MSENIRGITFAEQSVTPADDAIVRRAMLGDGILFGCEITYSGSTLTMAAGYIIACGRSFQITTAQNWAIVDATSGFARLLATIDLTQTATETAFNQISFSIEYASAEDGFVDLEQEDINNSGTKYQIVVAVVSLGTGGITGIVSKLEKTESGSGLSMELLWENASYSSEFASQTITIDGAGDYSKYQILIFLTGGPSQAMLSNEAGRSSRFFLISLTKGSSAVTRNARNFTVNSGQIIFEDNITLLSGGSGAVSNSALKPYRIYGIKGATT